MIQTFIKRSFARDIIRRSILDSMRLTTRTEVHLVDYSGKKLSWWDDIPMQSEGYNRDEFNFVNEIPQNTLGKFEINTTLPYSPIVQDQVKDPNIRDKKIPREYKMTPIFNYGAIPMTWEDVNRIHVHGDQKFPGDGDPIDVVEISGVPLKQFEVYKLRVLGAFMLIDSGEVDWKVIAIRKGDALAAELNDIGDVEAKCPGVVTGIREWFRWYKTPDGKPLNAFGYDERALDKAKAIEVIAETHDVWKKLKGGAIDKKKLWIE